MITTTAADLPVDLELVRKHVRQPLDLDDELLQGVCIPAATAHTETFLNRQLMPQVAELRLDKFPVRGFSLVADPIRAVNSVTYYDIDNALQTFSSSYYETDLTEFHGYIRPVVDQQWPQTYDRLHAVQIEMNVGYASAAAIPLSIRLAVLMLTMHLYDHPSATDGEKVMETPLGYDSLLWPHRIVPV